MKITRKSGTDSTESFDRPKKNKKGSEKLNQIRLKVAVEKGCKNTNISEVNSNYTYDKVKLINYFVFIVSSYPNYGQTIFFFDK